MLVMSTSTRILQMPIRSKGCLNCRQRKVRCDEARPSCLKCQTHGVPCSGYRTDRAGGLEFMDQTNTVVKRAKQKQLSKQHSACNRVPSPSLSSCDGSQGSTTSTSTDLSLRREQQQSLIYQRLKLMGFCSDGPSNFVWSPAVNRSQLYGNFLDVYLPKSKPIDHFVLFQDIVAKHSDLPELLQGLDSLSLLTMGFMYQNRVLIQQAIQRYGESLRNLSKSISRGDYMYNDDVLATVSVLANCEFFDEIAKAGHGGWSKHVDGGQQLFLARGPDSFQSARSLLLLSNSKHGCLAHALICRQAPTMASPEWRAVAFRSPNQDSATIFYDLALQVPGLLGRHDSMQMDLTRTAGDIESLLNDLFQIEMGLRDWFSEWRTQAMTVGKALFELKPIDDFPTFTSVCFDRTFSTAFMFSSFPIGFLCAMYWATMFALRECMQSLVKLAGEGTFSADHDFFVPESELYIYCTDLCRSIPFFTEPLSAAAGSVATFLPLRTAAVYFASHTHWPEAKWIGAVRRSVFIRGMSPPSIPNNPVTVFGRESHRLTELD
ncbi:Hypothetical protein R9X50_00441600 [Acrodontium crateriforme]|uniref:Zn(2)-C6 fungal-type domain-containing protein n=1 Tax=Acrodontium crateriforme TaxID=150365 RepID=A0AAQ3M5C8_9PEZI|nr:Hypothetical protein R9X50_00441600 [Acrodontium crateriforme]